MNPMLVCIEKLAYATRNGNQDGIKFFKKRGIDLAFCDHDKPYDFNTGEPMAFTCKDCERINS